MTELLKFLLGFIQNLIQDKPTSQCVPLSAGTWNDAIPTDFVSTAQKIILHIEMSVSSFYISQIKKLQELSCQCNSLLHRHINRVQSYNLQFL